MPANYLSILYFIRNAFQFRLPLCQRWYDWTTDHCDRLLEDALRTGSDRAIDSHYVGTITTMFPPDAKRTASHPLTVIDGQQRLATLSLILAAIAQNIPAGDAPDGFTPEEIRARYLMNPGESDDRRYKLLRRTTTGTPCLASSIRRSPCRPIPRPACWKITITS